MHVFLNKENSLRNIWWIAVFLLILFVCIFSLMLLADRFTFQVTIAHQVIILAIVSISCQLLRGKPISELTGRISLKWLKALFSGLIAGASLMLIPALLLSVFGYIDWEVNAYSFSTIWLGLKILLLAAIAEELLFRGFLFQRLIQAFGNRPAQIIIAGLFLLTHINNPNMTGLIKTLACINIFIASIMFGIAYIKTAGLAMPLGLHFMANFIQGTVLGFGVSGEHDPSVFTPVFDNAPIWLSGGNIGIEASVLGLCAVIITTVYLYYWNPTSYRSNS